VGDGLGGRSVVGRDGEAPQLVGDGLRVAGGAVGRGAHHGLQRQAGGQRLGRGAHFERRGVRAGDVVAGDHAPQAAVVEQRDGHRRADAHVAQVLRVHGRDGAQGGEGQVRQCAGGARGRGGSAVAGQERRPTRPWLAKVARDHQYEFPKVSSRCRTRRPRPGRRGRGGATRPPPARGRHQSRARNFRGTTRACDHGGSSRRLPTSEPARGLTRHFRISACRVRKRLGIN